MRQHRTKVHGRAKGERANERRAQVAHVWGASALPTAASKPKSKAIVKKRPRAKTAPHKCGVCGKAYAMPADLKRHKSATKHLDHPPALKPAQPEPASSSSSSSSPPASPTSAEAAPPAPPARAHRCAACEQLYGSEASLRKHQAMAHVNLSGECHLTVLRSSIQKHVCSPSPPVACGR
jgi:hypothetical protein